MDTERKRLLLERTKDAAAGHLEAATKSDVEPSLRDIHRMLSEEKTYLAALIEADLTVGAT